MLFPRQVFPAVALLGVLLEPLQAQLVGVYREVHTNLTRDAFSLARLTNHPNFLTGRPDQTTVLTSGLSSSPAGDDYGQRLRAYLTAPADGNYLFSISSDETSNLLLGTNENPATKQLIAWVDPRAQVGNYSTHYGQQSLPVALQAGRRYYVEVLHHEANLIEHLSVQWRLPSGATESPIPNTRLVYEIAPLIVSDLVNVTVEEGRPVVFAPALANFLPQTFRWQRDGADLPGATNSSHAIQAAALSDHGALFRAFITNRVGLTNTAEAQLTVLRDTNRPSVTGVFTANSTNIFVTYSEPVTAASVAPVQNHTLLGGTVLASELSADGRMVILRTTPLTFSTTYTLAIGDIRDRASTPNSILVTQVVFTAREFNAQPIGGGAQAGATTLVSGGADVTAGGSGVGGNTDQFQFAWQSVAGDFDYRVRVEALDFADLFAKAGLMARETLDADSRFAAAFATPTLAGCFFEARTNAGWLTLTSGSFPASYPSMWLRLKRAGSLFSGFASQDGGDWTSLSSANVTLSNRLYLGLAVSSHNSNQMTDAHFREFSSVTGGTVGAVPPRTEPLGPSSRKTGLVISEIMYHPRDVFVGTNKAELEFVELYNSNPYFEDLSGYRLSGDIDYTFPPGTVLQGGSFVVVARVPADVQSAYAINGVLGPFTNNLPNDQGRIRLRNQNDFVLLEVNYDSRHPWPAAADGAGHSLVLARPSHGENQREAWAASDSIDGSPGRLEPVSAEPLRAVVINEFLAHTDAPQQDFIELFNASGQPIDLGGAWLTDNPATNKFRLPSPTIIPARGFVSFTQTQLGFALSSAGERILLVNSNQTRVIDALRFDAQANGVSFGRFPDGTPGFQELASPTAGQPNADALGGVRPSSGAEMNALHAASASSSAVGQSNLAAPGDGRTPQHASAASVTRDIVINEIMYHPISENGDDEYVELFNKGASAVNLGGWRFTDGITYRFPSNTTIAAGGYLVVAKNRTNLLARYPALAPALVVGDFDGNLDNNGERLALARPELAVTADPGQTPSTNIIYVVVDEVEYRDGGRWGKWADGGGSSLELTDPRADNRLGPNWADSDETAKAPWATLEHTGMMDNGLASADHLHVVALEEGEFLLDDVEVFPVGSANRIANSTFETGLAGWTARGTHTRSSLENSGFNSTRSLRVRATARGDHGANQVRVPLSPVPSGNTTIRAKVRWLRGWPEVLLRLRGGFLEATDRMAIPTNLGTPGAPNSRLVANAAPAITETTHLPVVPAANQGVTVITRVSDVDGVASVVLKYRIDPSATLTTVPMNDAGTGGDAFAGDGLFSAPIPGQPADTIVAFVIEATDAAGSPATSRFPALRDDNGPVRECLIHFGSPTPAGAFGTYRFWLTRQSITNWAAREVLSNERIPGTFVYGNHRVIHESGSRYSGSAAHQDQAAPDYSPVGTPNNYTFDLPRDELVLGTDNFNKVHGAGNNHHDDNTLQRETTAYWMAQQLGLHANYKRFVAMYINGARRGTLMEDTQVPNGEVIESVYPDDSEGDLHKISVWYEPNTGTGQVLSTAASTEAYLNNYPTTGGVKKRARYRWNWQPRAVKGSANDFTNLFTLVDVAGAPTNAAYVPNLDAIADVENWMRTFALEHALGNWDSFGYRNQQNMYAYKPERGRWTLLIWDINIIFGGGTRGTPVATNDSLLEIDAADVAMNAIYSTPAYRRAYWRALDEIAQGVFLNANADPVMDSRFAAFEASGVRVTAPNLIKHWMAQRRAYILAELAKVNAADFTVAGPGEFTSTTNLIAFSGLAPVGLHTILVNGVAWPVTWTSLTNWTLRVPLAQATNQLVFLGRDVHGDLLPGASRQVTVVYTGPILQPQGSVVINEIMYHPTNAGAAFVELFNRSAFAFDLSGWRINGLDYEFPAGSVMAGQQALALAKNRAAYLAAYGTNTPPPFDAFDGLLDADGETLTLLQPGTNGSPDRVIDKVRYEARLPWATGANGLGASLQLIDPAQDNSRPSNWTDRQGWQQVMTTGIVQGGASPGTNFLIFVSGPGEFYIDDIVLVTGAVANAGANLIVNGGFESELTGPWAALGNHSNSVISVGTAHSGNGSLRVVGTGVGGPAAAVRQFIPAFVSNTVCTVSFWFRPGTNGTQGQVRTTAGAAFIATFSIRPASFTPGAANNDQRELPAYDPLWLNELQAQNTAGIADNFGEREPWIELYNAGANTLSLDGYFLADNYDSNLTPWPFPPGSSIAPGEFKIVWADGEPGEATGAHLHTSFRLNSATGSVALVRLVGGQPQITDYLTYANLGPALAYGDFPDGQPFTRRILQTVTPGATNVARGVSVFINEWMASNTNTLADPSEFPNLAYDDWFELYNAGPGPVDLGGYWLTDNLANPRGFLVPSNGVYVIPPGGFLLVWADEDSIANSAVLPDLHVNFRLNASREEIGLFAPDLTLIDSARFTNQVSDVSEGRFADGASAIYPMTTPTPRLPNTLGGGNTPPQLAFIADTIVTLGQTLRFTASATDAESPPQTLSFSLEGTVPSGAAIGATSGLFTWTPTAQQSPGTNALTVRATDSGTPPLSATRNFTVVVVGPPRLSGITPPLNGVVTLTLPAIAGKTYRVEYKNNLNDTSWTPLGGNRPAASATLTITDNLGAQPQRFYQVLVLD
jgi:regulation of enolase protein 1 (concanavalin A-like superfamily)